MKEFICFPTESQLSTREDSNVGDEKQNIYSMQKNSKMTEVNSFLSVITSSINELNYPVKGKN